MAPSTTASRYCGIPLQSYPIGFQFLLLNSMYVTYYTPSFKWFPMPLYNATQP